jgi:hypothetical protein
MRDDCTCKDWVETIGLLIIARHHWTDPECTTHHNTNHDAA